MKALSILKLGEHKSNKRIWIANRNIFKSGLSVGSRISVKYLKNSIEFIKDNAGKNTVSGRNESSPVIDLKNSQVSSYLGRPEKVEVRFYENKIVVSVAKNEFLKNERIAKSGSFKPSCFELFCGGGVLHSYFKNAGFRSAGGVEMEDQFLAVFDENNQEKDVLTICASIEDVSPDDYPKDVTTLIAGIPCDSFSLSNKTMVEELKKMREGYAVDSEIIQKRYTSEALVYHVLRATEAMNPLQVVIEEVPGFATTNASMLLRTILIQKGYHLTEVVSESIHTKRKRWCLVGDMNGPVSLKDLPNDDGKIIEDFLDGSIEDRNWVKVADSKRLSRAERSVGLRSHLPSDKKTNTFTTHSTRSTECCLKKPGEELYSEFSNSEIQRIHGVKNYILPEGKTLARKILGQGVADQFEDIAKRVFASAQLSSKNSTTHNESGQIALFA